MPIYTPTSKTSPVIQFSRKPELTLDSPTSVIVFDPRVDDLSTLLSGVRASNRAYVLSPERDGIEQITEILQQQPATTLTLVTHGFPGGLQLGANTLELGNISAYASQLSTWFALDEAAQINLLACSVAAGDAGSEFVEKLQLLSRAQITASARPLGRGTWLPAATKLFTDETLNTYQATLNWELVGRRQFSAENIDFSDLEVDDTTPYVVYQARDRDINVLKFEDDAWRFVGVTGAVGRNSPVNVDLELINGVPHVAFYNENGRKADVIKFENNTWTQVGASSVSSGRASHIDLEIDINGTPYVLYKNDGRDNETAVLKRLVNDEWVAVGPESGFSLGPIVQVVSELNLENPVPAGTLDLEIDGTTPYVVYNYVDAESNERAIVQRFANGTWETVGNTDFSNGSVNFPNLEIFDGIPYLVYGDPSNGGRVVAKVLNEAGVWETLGAGDISGGEALTPDLEFDSAGTPYVVYRDPNTTENRGKATVKKLENGRWVNTGNPSFSEIFVSNTDLAFDSNGIPYVLYRDDRQATVRSLPTNTVADVIDPVLNSITRKDPDLETTAASTLVFQATFSEEVIELDSDDFTINGGSESSITDVTSVGNGVYDITVARNDTASFSGNVGLDLAATQNITDAAGNALATTEPEIDETYAVSAVVSPNPPGTTPVDPPDITPPTVLNSLLTPLTGANVLEITQAGDAQALTVTVSKTGIASFGELSIFSTDESGNNRRRIGGFTILEEEFEGVSQTFNLIGENISGGTFLQFEVEEKGLTTIATFTSNNNSEVILDFGGGTEVTTSLTETTPAFNFTTPDATGIDLTGVTGTVNARFTVHREAALDNTIGLYVADREDGAILDSLTKTFILPGQAGYKEAVLANRLNIELTGENNQVRTFDTSLNGGDFLSMFIVTGGIDPVLANEQQIFYSHEAGNADGVDHFKKVGDNAFGVEDIFGGGDFDYDDMYVQIDYL